MSNEIDTIIFFSISDCGFFFVESFVQEGLQHNSCHKSMKWRHDNIIENGAKPLRSVKFCYEKWSYHTDETVEDCGLIKLQSNIFMVSSDCVHDSEHNDFSSHRIA